MSLLARAREAGLVLWVQGGRLALEGPETAEALALGLLANEPAVLAELAVERAKREAAAPFAVLPPEATPERPSQGWIWTGGVWVGPSGELASPHAPPAADPDGSWEDAP